jgi:hypothetical protein
VTEGQLLQLPHVAKHRGLGNAHDILGEPTQIQRAQTSASLQRSQIVLIVQSGQLECLQILERGRGFDDGLDTQRRRRRRVDSVRIIAQIRVHGFVIVVWRTNATGANVLQPGREMDGSKIRLIDRILERDIDDAQVRHSLTELCKLSKCHLRTCMKSGPWDETGDMAT